MPKMTGKQAIAILSRYAPCPHEHADTRLGTGDVWAKCEDCGDEFRREDWHYYRAKAEEFNAAIARLTHLVL